MCPNSCDDASPLSIVSQVVMLLRAGPGRTRTRWCSPEFTHSTRKLSVQRPVHSGGEQQTNLLLHLLSIPVRQVFRNVFIVAAEIPASGSSRMRTVISVPRWA